MRIDLRSPAYYDPLYPAALSKHHLPSWVPPTPTTPSPPPSTPFRFFDLPTELRLKIFRYLLPQNHVIEISPRTMNTYKPHYTRIVGYWGHAVPTASSIARMRLKDLPTDPSLSAASNIFAVSKRFRAEAGDVVYGENTFRFVITRDAPTAKDVENPFKRVSTGLLQKMWKCELVILEVLERPEVYRRVRRWLEQLVQRMGEGHALRRLTVELTTGTFVAASRSIHMAAHLSRIVGSTQKIRPRERDAARHGFQFVLEPLAKLRGVADVKIEGHVDQGLRGMIEEVMGKEAGWNGLKLRRYPEKVVLRKKKSAVKKTYQALSTKKFWQPEFDWGVLGEDEVMSSD